MQDARRERLEAIHKFFKFFRHAGLTSARNVGQGFVRLESSTTDEPPCDDGDAPTATRTTMNERLTEGVRKMLKRHDRELKVSEWTSSIHQVHKFDDLHACAPRRVTKQSLIEAQHCLESERYQVGFLGGRAVGDGDIVCNGRYITRSGRHQLSFCDQVEFTHGSIQQPG